MREDVKLFLPVLLMVILMIVTGFLMQYVVDLKEKPYTFVVNDKYYLYGPFVDGYYVEDLNMPLTHSRRISDHDEWNRMKIGKTYSCKNTPIDIFDMNPHHKSMYCEEV